MSQVPITPGRHRPRPPSTRSSTSGSTGGSRDCRPHCPECPSETPATAAEPVPRRLPAPDHGPRRVRADHNLTTMADLCADTVSRTRRTARRPWRPSCSRGSSSTARGARPRPTRASCGSTARSASAGCILANELVDPAALRWLAAELDRDPDFEFACWVDTERGVELMTEALREAAPTGPVDVLVELGAARRPHRRARPHDRAQGRRGGRREPGPAAHRRRRATRAALAKDTSADGLRAVHTHLAGPARARHRPRRARPLRRRRARSS